MESDLRSGGCQPCEGGMAGLSAEAIQVGLQDLTGWQLDGNTLRRDYHFKNFYETMAFVNAVAWIANREDHHPDMEVGYGCCVVRYSTHAIDGLTANDFICARQINALLA
ncbi:putative pterin-4-alpha-carbinolamine dehydratase [Acidithiobacillus ferrivorans]|uniref:Putative pterin-4-alpha-carbinolamine dehydratase n=1 Tax=Acidithiobacillus ferrivorans TaxID=160808 RepID=A0A060UQJ0_9PROT|nr:4a-hydroxytetrahydrobiopterin dehydratase [Acidithiobacillus ferrivorans]CDQ09053.1 putative pterin-4-alpha-carbinolamine dehydratase [Acidithiobacillus ferrivorans]SMH65616.1 putative pterin-4-alpha-carbinolamine dehydratase [Acidithiobacillus ferrivorans]